MLATQVQQRYTLQLQTKPHDIVQVRATRNKNLLTNDVTTSYCTTIRSNDLACAAKH